MKKARRHYEMAARTAKADATKMRIRQSAMQLYCERPIEDFTLDEVAKRAETTVRTILRAFGSKDELIYAALDEMGAGGIYTKPLPQGDVRAAVSWFFEIYESVGDLVIQRLAEERRRPALKPELEAGRKNHRAGVRTAFAPQLKAQTTSSRAELLTILTVATDVYVWKLLRRDMALSRPAAEALVRKMITSVTGEEMANG
jgi:AcrR family transcriptional regulator